VISRGARLAFEAINRRDYEAGFLTYSEDGETIYPAEFVQVGLVETTTRGRTTRVDVQRRWDADWGDFRNEPDEVTDLGDRVLVLARMVGSGASSGASFDREVAYLLTVSNGLAIREQVFLSHGEALEAAGLAGG
jgi:ketosteroid isomerase-like protein